MSVTRENLHLVLTHPELTRAQEESEALLRRAAVRLGEVILDEVPASADQQAALRKLREVVQTATAGLALQGLV